MADAAGNPSQPDFEGGAVGIGEDERDVEGGGAEAASDCPWPLPGIECHDRINARMVLPEVGEFVGRKEGEVSVGHGLAEALERGGGHDGVAEPVDTAH
jgi:hypothetical protein